MATSSSCKAVIIEGCDKCGKTSLADALHRALGWPVVKHSQPRGDALAEYAQTALDHEYFIADRYHLGESVYGPLYRGTDALDRAQFDAFENLVEETHRPLLVLMEDDPARVTERFATHSEDFARPLDVGAILQEFRYQWRRSRFAKVRTQSYGELLNVVVQIVRHMS